MSVTIPVSFVVGLTVFTLTCVPVYLIFQLFKRSTRNRKSPLNIDLLRSPGQSLREDIVEATIDIIGELMLIPFMVSMLYAMDLTNRYFYPEKASLTLSLMTFVMGVAVCTYFIIKAYRLMRHRNTLRLGYECELAVGQDLNGLISNGFRVYHDFPADGFNIDHIAIGPTGVFAIETKGRSKQLNGEKENWKVSFDGEVLQFPSWSERDPAQQAIRQAQWLSRWIASSTGDPQQVIPVLALPGWYTMYTKPPRDIRLYNGKNSQRVVSGKPVLTEKRITAIAHQVESKCRDVKAQSYRKD